MQLWRMSATASQAPDVQPESWESEGVMPLEPSPECARSRTLLGIQDHRAAYGRELRTPSWPEPDHGKRVGKARRDEVLLRQKDVSIREQKMLT
jgi:hypothetical protein